VGVALGESLKNVLFASCSKHTITSRKIEGVDFYEKMVNFYCIANCHIPDVSNLPDEKSVSYW
jgi:hypothetical protein